MHIPKDIYLRIILLQLKQIWFNCQFVVLETSVCVSITAFSCHSLNMNFKNVQNVVASVLKEMVEIEKVYKDISVESVIQDFNLQSEKQI